MYHGRHTLVDNRYLSENDERLGVRTDVHTLEHLALNRVGEEKMEMNRERRNGFAKLDAFGTPPEIKVIFAAVAVISIPLRATRLICIHRFFHLDR